MNASVLVAATPLHVFSSKALATVAYKMLSASVSLFLSRLVGVVQHWEDVNDPNWI